MFAAFGFGTGPSVLPGDYTITINAGNNKMAKTLKVTVDPRIKISDADLADQLSTGMEMRDLVTKLNNLVTRLDDISGQLNAIAERNQRRTVPAEPAAATDGATGGSAPAVNPADIRTAQDQLKALRAKLVRECTMGYRCQGRLRDEANSLMSSINGTIAKPTEGQKTAMREMKEETSRAVDELNQIVNTSIKKINDQMSSMPHISTGGR